MEKWYSLFDPMQVTITTTTTAAEMAEFVMLLRGVHDKLDRILAQVSAVILLEAQMDAALQAKLDDLTAKVNQETTVNASAVTLLQGLTAEIAALKSTTTDPAVLAAIDTLASSVSAQTASLAAAVTANTPAA